LPERPLIKKPSTYYEAGTIIAAGTGAVVSFADLLADLSGVRVVYVGEEHPNRDHHRVQLEVIKALYKRHPNVAVGMEMFDQTYQPILDLWSAGRLDQETFLQKVHWYANWKYDFDLYRDILDFVKNKKIRLVGLNIPFHIPPKIAVGGIENLSDEDKKFVPKSLDTSDEAHRAYLEKVFKQHHFKGMDNFDYFYQAQCVWEDAMAASIARNLKTDMMIVLAGNGHIIHKFGIPKRVFERTHADFRTICPVTAGSQVESDNADYIWVTARRKTHP
jgi:uncharacterized iron-regulated protein